jgi:hypothetical protein
VNCRCRSLFVFIRNIILIVIVIIIVVLILILSINSSPSGSAITVKFELAVSDLGAFPVGGRSVDVSSAKQQSNLYCLVLHTLEGPSDVYRKLSQGLYRCVINEERTYLLRHIKDYSHYSLSSSDGAVGFYMYFIIAHWLALTHEGIKHVLTEVFAFDHHLLFLGMLFRVERGQRVDAIGHRRHSRCNRSGIETEHARTSDHTDLGTSRHQYMHLLLLFEILFYFSFKEGTLRESAHHEYELHC